VSVCTGAATGIRYQDRLARRESLYRLHYLGQRYDRVKVIVKQTCTVLDMPLGLEDVEAITISRQSAHEDGKVVSRRHRPPLSPNVIDTLGTHFSQRLSRPQGHNAAGRVLLLRSLNDSIWNRNHILPACSALPEIMPVHTD
jgi:hypothetical protein